MDLLIWSHCERILKYYTNSEDKRRSIQTLASVRSLIINPSTSDSTIASIIETLAQYLQINHDPPILRHVLKLFLDLAFYRIHLAQRVFSSACVKSILFGDSTRLVAETLSVLVSASELDSALVSFMDEFGENFYVSLCFRPNVSVRSWLLLNADRFRIRPYLLFTVLLGFTKDPYPYLRRVALEELVKLSESIVCEDISVIEGCYCRAIELLQDSEDCVRSTAVRAVSGWWRLLVASNQGKVKEDWSDALFVKLCSMVRDMSMEVRVEALNALGKMEMVSDDNMLQTLSKKVLGITKEKKTLNKCTMEMFGILAADGAGAFVHGIEDEFHEVRQAACRSLRTLIISSSKCVSEALNLMMDMLNDDTMTVQLEALDVIYRMASSNRLYVQETHMHMFLGTLVDNEALARTAARNIVRGMKLSNLDMFKSYFDGLIKNLEMYPQDEADVFCVLFNIGRRHGGFAICVIKDGYQEIEPPCEGTLRSNSARLTALLVLAISAPFAHDQHDWSIPPKLYSYALTMLGRISQALSDVMDQGTLLAYLSCCSKSTRSASETQERESFLKAIRESISDSTRIEKSTSSNMSLVHKSDGPSQGHIQIMSKMRDDTHIKLIEYVQFIFSMVADMWPLIQSGYMEEVLRTLRIYKEGLTTLTTDSLKNAGVLAFTLRYLLIVKLLTRVWVHFLPERRPCFHVRGELDSELGKLENCLREMKYRLMGLSEEEELQVLELTLLTCILKLSEASEVKICYNMKNLSTTVSRMDQLHQDGFSKPSKFFIELKELLCKNGTFSYEDSCNPLVLKKLIAFFSLQKFGFCGRRLEYLKAKIEIPSNDSLHPLPFIPGLPVGISCNITLFNISNEKRLWVKLTAEEVKIQFVYVDLNQFEDFDGVKNFTYVVPFYNTPKAISFTLRVSIVMECPSENVAFTKGIMRQKHELTYLCKDVEVFLSMVQNG